MLDSPPSGGVLPVSPAGGGVCTGADCSGAVGPVPPGVEGVEPEPFCDPGRLEVPELPEDPLLRFEVLEEPDERRSPSEPRRDCDGPPERRGSPSVAASVAAVLGSSWSAAGCSVAGSGSSAGAVVLEAGSVGASLGSAVGAFVVSGVSGSLEGTAVAGSGACDVPDESARSAKGPTPAAPSAAVPTPPISSTDAATRATPPRRLCVIGTALRIPVTRRRIVSPFGPASRATRGISV